MRVPEFARYWAREIGAEEDSLERLSGGINNNVFVCSSKDKQWVIKGYPQVKTGRPDRMQAEVDFLEYSACVAQKFTPTLIEVDTLRRCTIMEHISGEIYCEGVTPDQNELRDAFCFFNTLNSDLDLAKKMIRSDAAEGFLSLRQHMENVIKRIADMGTEHLPNKYKSHCDDILYQLRSKSERLAISLEAKIRSGALEDVTSSDERCISPSDFGFHNALRTRSGVVFIDFEFAGWDDPAKFCVDFTLQQRNPTYLSPIDVASMINPDRFRLVSSRLNAMSEILLLKWFCIILGIFNPEKLTKSIYHEYNEDISCDLIVSRQLMRYQKYCRIHCAG